MSTNLHTMKDGKESDPIFQGLILFSLKKLLRSSRTLELVLVRESDFSPGCWPPG